jgi:hypothetical protein
MSLRDPQKVDSFLSNLGGLLTSLKELWCVDVVTVSTAAGEVRTIDLLLPMANGVSRLIRTAHGELEYTSSILCDAFSRK